MNDRSDLPLPKQDSVEREDPFARRVKDALWPAAATLATVTGLLTFASFPFGGWRHILARTTFALIAFGTALLAMRWRRHPPDLARAHLAAGGLCLLGTLGVAVQFLTMQEPVYTVNLAVALVASSALLLQRRWLLAVAAALIGVWCLVGLRQLEASEWEGFRMIMPRVAVVAFGIQEALRRSARRSWEWRVELERRQREREATARELREAQRLESIASIAGGLAHDFNNLLVSVLGNAELALGRLPDDSPAREDLAGVVEAGERASVLTNQLLTFSGGARAERSVLSLDQEVAELSALLAATLPKGTRLSIERSPALPPVEVDRGQLQQILMNLVGNAGEAGSGSSNRVSLRTGVRTLGEAEASALRPPQARAGGDYVFLEVRDQGCGMDPDTQARMFDPFFSRKGSGRGLGLAAVVGIVRGHEAGLEVESQPGQGTCVRVLFRASRRRIEAKPPKAAPGALPAGLLVLIVDDEPQVRAVAAGLLEVAGARVLQAPDGSTAIEQLLAAPEQIGAVLLDMTMGGLSGEETLAHLLAIRPDLPVVLTSGYEENAALAESLGKRHVTFLAKPYRAQALTAKLASVTGGTSSIRTAKPPRKNR